MRNILEIKDNFSLYKGSRAVCYGVILIIVRVLSIYHHAGV